MSDAYILSLDHSSERGKHTKELLDRVLFNTILCDVKKHNIKSFSNRLSMLEIMKKIAEQRKKWSYVFEDDIQFWNYIGPQRLKSFEKASKNFFYLGACSQLPPEKTDEIILSMPVYRFKNGDSGCCHAFGITKAGAQLVLEKEKDFDSDVHFDQILSSVFQEEEPLVVMGDNVSYQNADHYGIVFQDRFGFSDNPPEFIPNVSIKLA